MSNFKKAAPIDRRLLIGISGPQGSGKTTTALRIATGLVKGTGKRIAFIDTENKRGLEYAKNFDFDHCDFQPPFRPGNYLQYIQEADNAGYGVIVIDSASHEHEGPGGVLEWQEEELQRMAGNDYAKRERMKFTAWIKPKQERNKLIQFGLQRTHAHVILCMRAKEKMEMRKNDKGKLEPVNVGLMPIGAEEFGYEMSIMMMLNAGSKGHPDWSQPFSRINDLDGPLTKYLHTCGQMTEVVGEKIKELLSVKPAAPQKEFIIKLKAGDKEFDLAEEWMGEFLSIAGGLKQLDHVQKFKNLHDEFINKLSAGQAQQLNEALHLIEESFNQSEGITI